jgi:hypothetical protein
MHLSPKAYFLFLLIVVPFWGQAQFAEVYSFGEAGNDNGQYLLAGPDNSFFIGGTIDDDFSPLGTPLSLFGEQDIFFGQVDAGGDWLWAAGAGSFLIDELKAMELMPDGGLFLTGTFWLTFQYGTHTLTADDNIKGIFVMRLDAAGNWQWGKVINGADLKEISDAQVDEQGNIYLTGHFSESIQFDDLVLEANGRNDAFLLKLNDSGELQDWQQAGTQGTTRGQTIALHPDGGYYWGGIFNDTLLFDTTQLQANTFDPDLFLIRYSADGTPLWIRKAGGVFEVDLTDMQTDSEGNLLATGFFFGVVTLSENLSIQSRNGNPDIFLLKYNENGALLWARAVGGPSVDQSAVLIQWGEELIVGGRYQEAMAWDGLSVPATSGVSGFVASFAAADGTGNWLYAVETDEFAFVEDLVLTDEDQLFALGSFRGSAQLGQLQINSPAQYNAFLTEVTPGITPAGEPSDALAAHVYPNPVHSTLYLFRPEAKPGTIYIYNARGQVQYQSSSYDLIQTIDFSGLAAGVYWLVVQQENRRKAFRVIKE